MHRMQMTASAIVLPAIGASFMGGYYAGIIDTTVGGAIQSGDAATTGARYALIVSPKSQEFSLSSYALDSVGSRAVPFLTRWDGLTATTQAAAVGTGYEAFKNVVNNMSAPSDGGSIWYIPALDEAELLYRNFKPSTEANYLTGSPNTSGTAPASSQAYGYNPSSSPAGSAYTSGSPVQTAVSGFVGTGGAQSIGTASMRVIETSTQQTTTNFWEQYLSGTGVGQQTGVAKTSTSSARCVRPVRRVLL